MMHGSIKLLHKQILFLDSEIESIPSILIQYLMQLLAAKEVEI